MAATVLLIALIILSKKYYDKSEPQAAWIRRDETQLDRYFLPSQKKGGFSLGFYGHYLMN